MIAEAKELRENQSLRHAAAINQANKQLQSNSNGNGHEGGGDSDDEEQLNSRTMKEFPADCGTLVPGRGDEGDGTMIAHTDCGTLVPDNGTMVELQSNLGTMVINSDSEESTMKSKKSVCPVTLSLKRNETILQSQGTTRIQTNRSIGRYFWIISIRRKPRRPASVTAKWPR